MGLDMAPEKLDFGAAALKGLDIGSESPDFGFTRPNSRSEGPHFGS